MGDRREGNRRQRLLSLRLPDRRRGFRRRDPASPLVRAYHGYFRAIRDDTTIIALLASLLLALNLADLTLTQRALAAGAIEVNPLMAALFATGRAVAVKLGVGGVAVWGLWLLRRYRPALAALTWACVGMGLLVGYQVALVAVIA
jgi:hypothetical protein